MKVVWMEQAEDALSRTAEHIRDRFGKKVADRLLGTVYHMGCLLEDNPHMGSIEPLMAHRAITYRSIVVNRLNKIIYRIVDNRIEIADFWDVRREPSSLADQV